MRFWDTSALIPLVVAEREEKVGLPVYRKNEGCAVGCRPTRIALALEAGGGVRLEVTREYEA